MTGLPEPDFIARDPVAVTSELIATYEAMTGRTLQPAQVERLLIDLIAYSETLVRIGIQEAAKQNLVAYSRGVNLDHHGALLGVSRLPAKAAATTLEFTLAAAEGQRVAIPKGTRVKTKDGAVVFATTERLVIPAGALAGSAPAIAGELGEIGNGYLPGEVATLMDPIAGVAAATNTATTYGGAAVEDDERLRQRIQEAPERFSVAGPGGAYRWHAMTSHQSLVDAAVVSPTPGVVQVYPLGKDGIPAPEILDVVLAALNDDKVRPLTDLVQVLPPTEVAYTIDATLTLLRGADQVSVEAAARKAAEAYAAGRRAGLGRDLIHSQIIAALSVPGVYKVQVNAPAERVVDGFEWANCASIALSFGGAVDG